MADNGGSGDHTAPQPGSPAINAGGPTTLPSDQRGQARVIGGVADMGAVEADPAVVRTLGVIPVGTSTQPAYGLRAREVAFYRFELDGVGTLVRSVATATRFDIRGS